MSLSRRYHGILTWYLSTPYHGFVYNSTMSTHPSMISNRYYNKSGLNQDYKANPDYKAWWHCIIIMHCPQCTQMAYFGSVHCSAKSYLSGKTFMVPIGLFVVQPEFETHGCLLPACYAKSTCRPMTLCRGFTPGTEQHSVLHHAPTPAEPLFTVL